MPYLNNKYSITKPSEVNFKKTTLSDNQWLIFLNQHKINHRIVSLKQNDIIIFNTNTNLYIILTGSAILKRVLNNTKTITLNILAVGDVFGHYESNSNNAYLEIEAIDHCTIIYIEQSILLNACNNYPTLNVFFANRLLLCLTKTYHFIEILSHKNITNRLVSLLLLFSEYNGIQYNNGILINLTITHRLLSQIIGSNRVSITRIMSDLLQTKLISIQKKKIIIHNPILLTQRVLNK